MKQAIKTKEVSSIRAKIEATIARELVYQKYHKMFRDVLAKWEGKKITKRLLTDLQKAIPDARFIWDEIASMLYIKVYNTPEFPSYENNHRVFIGYTSRYDHRIEGTTQYFQVQKYDEINPSVDSASRDRVVTYEKLLASDYPERHQEAIEKFHKATLEMLEVLGDYPSSEDREYMRELGFSKLEFNERSTL